MVMKFSVVREPRALALAVWTRELMPSTRPLLMRERNQRSMPLQCFLMVLAASMTGLSRLCVAQKYHFLK